ncbi:MAG TPA: calcium-binding protein, partial [Allosphingosinicella sp.]
MAQLTGTSGDDTLFGIGEADSINGLEGSDTIVGGAGNDTIESDHWIEFYIPDPSRPFNVITLHHYDDEVADHIDGGNGIDWARLDFHLNSSAVSLDFTNPAIQQTTAYGTTIVNVERIHFVGGSGGDTVTAGAYADTLSGGGGADILNGAGGDDHIAARFGDGADNLNGGDGVDLATLDFRFANGGGTYDFSNPAAVVALVEGTQIVNVERFDFQLSEHGEVVTGGGYDDKFNGNGGDDQLRGGGGNDLLSGSSGTDLLSGEGGDDTIEAYDDAGADTIDGGDGIDLLKLHLGFRTTAVSYSFADPFATTTLADGTTVIGVERVAIVGGSADDFFAGGGYDDSIDGNGGSDLVFGGGGNDFIVGDGGAFADERGNDTLDGGAGDDRISGMGGDDYLVGGDDDDSLAGGHGTDELYGQAGDDSLEAGFNDGADIVDGGDGIDLVIITASGDFGPSGDLIYNFSNPGAVYAIEGGATISNVERVDMTGASGNDQLTGGAYADRFLGFSGNDTLRGGGGNDSLNGMTGQDFLFGDAGEDDFTYILTAAGAADRDAIDGGADIDFIFLNHTLPTGPANYDFSNSAATITRPDGTTIVNVERIKYWGGTGVDTIGGGAYDDEILGAGGNDSILGRDGSDRLEGGSGEDFLNGDQGNDKVYGGEGGDTLFGGGYTGPENDELYGDAGTDFLVGSGGDDILDGGKDSDVDKLHGGVGNDTYHMYAGDIFATAAESGQGQEAEIDGFGGGVDHVISHASSYTLLYSFENLTLAANAVSGFGSEDDNEILGNDDNNLIGGNGGNDKIFGGTGRDTLSGGAGFDFFYLADGDAEAGESFNGGADSDRIDTASARLDLSGVTINELEAIQTVRGAGTAFIVDTAAHAVLVNGAGGYDSLTVNDET